MATVEWRTTTHTQHRFRELLLELQRAREFSDEHLQLVDDIKSLPGFPAHADPDADLIQLTNVTERTR